MPRINANNYCIQLHLHICRERIERAHSQKHTHTRTRSDKSIFILFDYVSLLDVLYLLVRFGRLYPRFAIFVICFIWRNFRSIAPSPADCARVRVRRAPKMFDTTFEKQIVVRERVFGIRITTARHSSQLNFNVPQINGRAAEAASFANNKWSI